MGWTDNIRRRVKSAFGMDLAMTGRQISRGRSQGQMTRAGYGGHAFSYSQSSLNEGVNDLLRLRDDLVSKYIDYENMDEYPEISSALDVYADDATVPNNFERSIWAKAEDEHLRNVIDDMLRRRLVVEEQIFPLARTIAKYGQAFGEVLATDKGVVGVNYLDPPTMRRVEDKRGNLLGFVQDVTGRFTITAKDLQDYISGRKEPGKGVVVFEPWEVVHWRLRTRKISQPYGDSVIEPARWAWRRLVLLEDSVLMGTILRGGQRYVYYVDVGEFPPDQAMAFLNEVKNAFKKKKTLRGQDAFSQRYNPISSDEEIWLPTRGGRESTRIEQLQGPSYRSMEDLEYFRDKLFAAIKTPKAYLGLTGQGLREPMSKEDLRFARTVMRLQREIRNGFRHIGRVHLATLNIDPDTTDWGFKMSPPSSVFRLNEVDLMGAEANLARDMIQFFPREWVMNRVFAIPKDEARQLIAQKKKENPEPQGGGGLFASMDARIDKMDRLMEGIERAYKRDGVDSNLIRSRVKKRMRDEPIGHGQLRMV